jgi:hypothetical protein
MASNLIVQHTDLTDWPSSVLNIAQQCIREWWAVRIYIVWRGGGGGGVPIIEIVNNKQEQEYLLF